MKYSVILVIVAAVMLLVGVGIRVHAEGKYADKMFYHTTESATYSFSDVFAERKIGNSIQVWSIVAGSAGCIWFVVLALRRDKRGKN